MRSFVSEGGSLYISGSRLPELMEEFGIRLNGKTKENVTYVVPTKAGESLFAGVNLDSPMMVDDHQSLVDMEGIASEEVLGTITLPYTDPKESAFASIHSNPPGKDTDYPAIICKKYGKGTVLWTSAGFEVNGSEPHKELFFRLVRMLAKKDLAFESTAPKPVEIICYYQADSDRYIVHVLNAQEQLPPLPVYDIQIHLNTGGKNPTSIRDIETGEAFDTSSKGMFATFTIPSLTILSNDRGQNIKEDAMKIFLVVLVMVGFLMLHADVGQADEAETKILVIKTAQTPVIDGFLSSGEWDAAAEYMLDKGTAAENFGRKRIWRRDAVHAVMGRGRPLFRGAGAG